MIHKMGQIYLITIKSNYNQGSMITNNNHNIYNNLKYITKVSNPNN